MQRSARIIKLISIAAACAALLLAAFGLFGGGRSDVALMDYKVSDEGILIKVGVASSAGYIRSMRVREDDCDAMVEFYSTLGINNPIGAKNEFLLEVSPDCERILFRRGKNHYRPVLQRDERGEWTGTEENIETGE